MWIKKQFITFLVGALATFTPYICRASPCQEATPLIKELITEQSAQEHLLDVLDGYQNNLSEMGLNEFYCHQVALNLTAKKLALPRGATFSPSDIENRTFGYELFKLKTYLSSSVTPKLYFGFFDEQGDTAEYEKIVRLTISKAVKVINDYAILKHLPVLLTEKEIAITFLAEGGALLLTDGKDNINRVHIYEIGLDDFRIGLAHYPGLVNELDSECGTKLGKLTFTVAGKRILLRPMTFREAILGTAIMYLFEKVLTYHKYSAVHKELFSNLTLDQQFVYTSLVYNSGILFADERIEQILRFETNRYLYDISELNAKKRGRLPLVDPSDSAKQLQRTSSYPSQFLSWNAVYHILQRYGAWRAVTQ